MKDPDTSEIDYILTECMVATAQACKCEIEWEASRYWIDHYRPRFYKAIVEKGRKWKEDRPNVIARAKVLGTTAADLAGTGDVTKAIAEAASKKVDCPLRGAVMRAMREIWCQE